MGRISKFTVLTYIKGNSTPIVISPIFLYKCHVSFGIMGIEKSHFEQNKKMMLI